MLIISPTVQVKLATKHRVAPAEIHECFANRAGAFLEDVRERHRSDPPTQWFIARTDAGRLLKVVFVQRLGRGGADLNIRTAYEPNAMELRIYAKFGSTPAS
jgi:hypothetical protein